MKKQSNEVASCFHISSTGFALPQDTNLGAVSLWKVEKK